MQKPTKQTKEHKPTSFTVFSKGFLAAWSQARDIRTKEDFLMKCLLKPRPHFFISSSRVAPMTDFPNIQNHSCPEEFSRYSLLLAHLPGTTAAVHTSVFEEVLFCVIKECFQIPELRQIS